MMALPAEALVDAIAKEFGGLHVLVNNAGITRDTLAMRMKDDDWDAWWTPTSRVCSV